MGVIKKGGPSTNGVKGPAIDGHQHTDTQRWVHPKGERQENGNTDHCPDTRENAHNDPQGDAEKQDQYQLDIENGGPTGKQICKHAPEYPLKKTASGQIDI